MTYNLTFFEKIKPFNTVGPSLETNKNPNLLLTRTIKRKSVGLGLTNPISHHYLENILPKSISYYLLLISTYIYCVKNCFLISLHPLNSYIK